MFMTKKSLIDLATEFLHKAARINCVFKQYTDEQTTSFAWESNNFFLPFKWEIISI